jgi:ElaA protein
LALRIEQLAFAELDAATLYAVLAARARCFVVEQRCAYQDPDGKDFVCQHLLARDEGRLLAYLRIVPPGLSFPEHAIGRVLTLPEARGQGLARRLMEHALHVLGPVAVCVSAQVQLVDWYGSMGFVATGSVYEEAGVAHRNMRRPSP